MSQYHLSSASTASGPLTVSISPESAGWRFSGLRVLVLSPGESHTLHTGLDELLVLPLSGGAEVNCGGNRFVLNGRPHVFAGTTDFAYLPMRSTVEIHAPLGGRFAIPAARARRARPARYAPAADVPVELRGAGQASRQVHNFCTPETFDTDRLLAVEVLTPGGNWSSYPPHKHDQHRADERELEEIYYFEIADQDGTPGSSGIGYQRVYASDPNRPIEVMAEVHTGDVVLVPHGYHGPSMAAPGYDMYYLNVMAGPARERAWLFRDDPAHAWVRGSWSAVEIDSRLPRTATSPVTRQGDQQT